MIVPGIGSGVGFWLVFAYWLWWFRLQLIFIWITRIGSTARIGSDAGIHSIAGANAKPPNCSSKWWLGEKNCCKIFIQSRDHFAKKNLAFHLLSPNTSRHATACTSRGLSELPTQPFSLFIGLWQKVKSSVARPDIGFILEFFIVCKRSTRLTLEPIMLLLLWASTVYVC